MTYPTRPGSANKPNAMLRETLRQILSTVTPPSSRITWRSIGAHHGATKVALYVGSVGRCNGAFTADSCYLA